MTRIEASAAVAARFVVCAEIQVLITEQTAPALLAQAVPRFQACSVHAAGITLAFVAQLALPAWMATGKKKKNGYLQSIRQYNNHQILNHFLYISCALDKREIQVPQISTRVRASERERLVIQIMCLR